jgi:uncharacterized membrane protein YdbT with pleckstrin-like domain
LSHNRDFLDPGEEILLVVYRHWVNIAPVLFAWAVVGLVFLFGFYAVGRFGSVLGANSGFAVLALAAATVLLVLMVYLTFYVYRQNRLIITNKNFIQVNRAGLLQHNVTQYPLDRIQDVTASQSGVFQHLLGYGDVLIETAGEIKNLKFYQTANPHEVADKIMDLHEKYGTGPDQP